MKENSVSPKKTIYLKSICNEFQYVGEQCYLNEAAAGDSLRQMRRLMHLPKSGPTAQCAQGKIGAEKSVSLCL